MQAHLRCGIRWAPVLALAACSWEPRAHVVLTIEDPHGLATLATAITYGEELSRSTRVELGDYSFPTAITLTSRASPAERLLWITAVGAQPRPLALGRVRLVFSTGKRGNAAVTLQAVCGDFAFEGHECALDDTGTGICRAGSCATPECGDGFIDTKLDEECDDGDLENPNDGCTAECRYTQWDVSLVVGETAAGDPQQVSLDSPEDVVIDLHGHLYVADTYNHQIWRIAQDAAAGGMRAVRFAGTGIACGDPRAPPRCGNNDLARLAYLSRPQALAADGFGSLYIGEGGNPGLRRIDAATGVITEISEQSGQLDLIAPTGLAVTGAGELLIAQGLTGLVWRLHPDSGVMTLFAGSGWTCDEPAVGPECGDGGDPLWASLVEPRALLLDQQGRLIVADAGNHRVRMIDLAESPPDRTITTIAGSGEAFGPTEGGAREVALEYPWGLAMDQDGNLLISLWQKGRVVRLDLEEQTVALVVGGGTEGTSTDGISARWASLNHTTGIAVEESGSAVVVESWNDRVRRVDFVDPADPESWLLETAVGGGLLQGLAQGAAAASLELQRVSDIAPCGEACLFFSDGETSTVGRATLADPSRPDSWIVMTVAGNGESCPDPTAPCGDAGLAVDAQLRDPSALAWDPAGYLYIAEASRNKVRRVNTLGSEDPSTWTIATVAGTGSDDCGVDPWCGDGGLAPNAVVAQPRGLVVGNGGGLFVSAAGQNRVRYVEPSTSLTGSITTVAGAGQPCVDPTAPTDPCGDHGSALAAMLTAPADLALSAQGDLLVADPGNHRVRRIAFSNPEDLQSGEIDTLAGTGEDQPPLDGQPATQSPLGSISDMALSPAGYLFVTLLTGQLISVDLESSNEVHIVAGGIQPEGNCGDGGSGLFAGLEDPVAVAVTPAGWVAIGTARPGYPRWSQIRRLDFAGGYGSDDNLISTLVGKIGATGDGPLVLADLGSPQAVVPIQLTPDKVDLLAADAGSGRIRLVDLDTGWVSTWLGYPQELAVCDGSLAGVARYAPPMQSPAGLAVDPEGPTIYVTQRHGHTIERIWQDDDTWRVASLAGALGQSGFVDGAAEQARFSEPIGLTLDQARQVLFVADSRNHVVRAISLSGTPTAGALPKKAHPCS